jgi:hypothetical protein
MDLLELLKEGAEKVPLTMERPDADWIPVFMYEDGNGRFHTGALADMTRDSLAEHATGLRQVLTTAKAVQVALVLPVWITEISGSGVDRKERVMVIRVNKRSTRLEAAIVLRSNTAPPELGPWDRVADDSEVGAGVFVDAMRAAIL